MTLRVRIRVKRVYVKCASNCVKRDVTYVKTYVKRIFNVWGHHRTRDKCSTGNLASRYNHRYMYMKLTLEDPSGGPSAPLRGQLMPCKEDYCIHIIFDIYHVSTPIPSVSTTGATQELLPLR